MENIKDWGIVSILAIHGSLFWMHVTLRWLKLDKIVIGIVTIEPTANKSIGTKDSPSKRQILSDPYKKPKV